MPPRRLARPKKAVKNPVVKSPSEDDICKAFIMAVDFYVSIGRLSEFDVYHVNNGEHSGGRISRAIAGARAKAMGQRSGVADYVLFGRHYLEMKSKRGTQSDAQKRFEAWCGTRGLTYRICKSADEATEYVLELRKGI